MRYTTLFLLHTPADYFDFSAALRLAERAGSCLRNTMPTVTFCAGVAAVVDFARARATHSVRRMRDMRADTDTDDAHYMRHFPRALTDTGFADLHIYWPRHGFCALTITWLGGSFMSAR